MSMHAEDRILTIAMILMAFWLACANSANARSSRLQNMPPSSEEASKVKSEALYADPQEAPTDPLLAEALAIAVGTHPTVRAAAASARAAGADLRGAKWGRFPAVSVQGLYLQSPDSKLEVQVAVEQPLWANGRIRQTITRAEAGKKAALANFDEAAQSIAFAVVRTYFAYVNAVGRTEALRDSLARHKEMATSMARRVEQEVSPQSDLELALARVAQVEQQLAATDAVSRTTLAQLRELVGSSSFTPDLSMSGRRRAWPPVDQAELLEAARRSDPRLQRISADVEIAAAEARIGRAEAFPEVVGQYTYSEGFGHRFGLALRAQTGGRGLSALAAADAARSREEAAGEQLVAAERDLQNLVISDITDYEASRARSLSAEGAEIATEKVNASYMRQFSSGRRTWLDVMNAVREATAARLDAIEARISTDASLARLMIRAGRWTIATNGDRP